MQVEEWGEWGQENNPPEPPENISGPGDTSALLWSVWGEWGEKNTPPAIQIRLFDILKKLYL